MESSSPPSLWWKVRWRYLKVETLNLFVLKKTVVSDMANASSLVLSRAREQGKNPSLISVLWKVSDQIMNLVLRRKNLIHRHHLCRRWSETRISCRIVLVPAGKKLVLVLVSAVFPSRGSIRVLVVSLSTTNFNVSFISEFKVDT